jgi:flavin-dependent dehydrogenase
LALVTDFSIGGPENYSWNVIRSEADDMMFRHAGKCGAKIFDGVKVDSIAFASRSKTSNGTSSAEFQDLGRPVSAFYTRKADGFRGEVKFDYIIDASGRAGLLSTKYLKNRSYNEQFKNIATWGYWKGTGEYAPGTKRFNAPFFEALHGMIHNSNFSSDWLNSLTKTCT